MSLSPALQRFLSEMEYPATKDDLLREALRERLSADDQRALRQLDAISYSAGRQVACALASVTPERTLVAA